MARFLTGAASFPGIFETTFIALVTVREMMSNSFVEKNSSCGAIPPRQMLELQELNLYNRQKPMLAINIGKVAETDITRGRSIACGTSCM
ncbi:MAG: hypothetical protein R3C12_16600 [Planctomycetaceae bacterium]|nr:hypothetical protein [Planctomycetaceae bacterium]